MIFTTSFYIITTFLRESSIINSLIIEGGFIEALAFISIGYYIGKSTVSCKYPLVKSLFFLIFYATIFQFVSFNKYADLILLISTFYLLVHISVHVGHKTVFSHLGNFSTNIYLHHMMFIQSFNILILINPSFYINNIFIHVFITTSLAVFFSVVINNLVRKFYIKPMSKVLFCSTL